MNALAKSLLAGFAATAVLVAVRNTFWAVEPAEVRERERRLREGFEATSLQVPVREASRALGVPLRPRVEAQVATGLAWLLGVLGVVGYAALRRRAPVVAAAGGALFGLAVWLVEDEGIIPALGWAKPPGAYPWQAHARGLAAHVAYGVAAERALAALDRA
ncbi:MAG TPA: DUF1440 domain-containing protein [Candidatus Thermoplasmatota archaeon]|nr:DUF1440 domain-containing protein [Candidatus Thermoplasmatota archaeon]